MLGATEHSAHISRKYHEFGGEAALMRLGTKANEAILDRITGGNKELARRLIAQDDYYRFRVNSGGTSKLTKESFDIPADPMRSITGSAKSSNPEEYNQILRQLEEMGVEVSISDGMSGARVGYGPSTMGQPGVISMDPDASLSAWQHELNHAIDDMNSGWRGREVRFTDPEMSVQWERNAYDIEIEAAKDAGRQDVADYLEELFQEEAARIEAFFTPDN